MANKAETGGASMSRFLLLFVCSVSIATSSLLFAQEKTTPLDPAVQQQYQAGQQALSAGKDKDAIDAFKRANRLASNSCFECFVGLAAAYTHQADLKNALDSCDRAVAAAADNSNKANAHAYKGKALLTIGKPDAKRFGQAEQEFRTAIELAPNDPVLHLDLAITLLRQSKDDQAREELQKCVAMNPTSTIAEQAKLLMANPRRGREEFAPDFKLTTLQGQDFDLKAMTGKIVVLDFWATWCPSCRDSVGELKELSRKYQSGKVVVISISADEDDAAWRQFIAKKKMEWPQYRDADRKVRKSFGVDEFPTYLVIDGEGVVKARIIGLDPREDVVHRLKATLAGMPQLEAAQGGK
jgi:peroxiredoxin/Tfp pilus assembly protein PilF